MKKVIAGLCVINILLLAALGLLLRSNLEPEKKTVLVENGGTDYIEENFAQFRLFRGDFELADTVFGVCTKTDDLQTLEFDNSEAKKVSFEVSRGCNVEKGTVIAKIGEQEILAEGRWRVIDFSYEGEKVTVEYLDFEKNYVTAWFPLEMFEKLTYDSEIFLEASEGNVPVKIRKLGWQVQDGKVEVQTDSAGYLLPGTGVNLKLVTKVFPDVIFIRNANIMEDNFGNYMYYEVFDEKGNRSVEKTYYRVLVRGDKCSVIEFDNLSEEYLDGWFYAEYRTD